MAAETPNKSCCASIEIRLINPDELYSIIRSIEKNYNDG